MPSIHQSRYLESQPMLVWLIFTLSLSVCLLSAGPFPGAVLLTPVLALFSALLSLKRFHWLAGPACLLNVTALGLAPISLRDEPIFIPLAVLVATAALTSGIAQWHLRAKNRAVAIDFPKSSCTKPGTGK